MTQTYTCGNCGGSTYEQVTQTQVRCLHCGSMTIFPDISLQKEFHLSADPNILDLTDKPDYSPAPLIKRFVNYLVDIFVAFGLLYLISFLLGIPMQNTGNESENILLSLFLLVFPMYYILMEYKFGKTIGKIFTRTKVVSTDGQTLTLKQCVSRTLCRIIPFERFSGLLFHGTFWHDSIPKTLVIEDQ